MNSLILSLVFFSTVATPAEIGRVRELKAASLRSIVRLEPSAFPQLPGPIANWMLAEGYAVPQSICATGPHNVLSGWLNEDEREDWAVLCSRADTSTFIIFWGGSLDSTTRYEPCPDVSMLQGMGGGTMGYSSLIARRTPQDIRENYELHGARAPDWVVHDGILAAYCDKGGVVLYWRDGRLVELLGSD